MNERSWSASLFQEKQRAAIESSKATNSQTSIPQVLLRATDKVHRVIQEYLEPFGLFYDRCKNMHKNEGRSTEQIIGIPLIAQAIMSISMQRPDDARARPSSQLKRDDDYAKIFSPDHPIELYLVAGKLIKAVQSYLRAQEDLRKDKNNLRFYAAMHAASKLTGKANPLTKDLAKIKPEDIQQPMIEESVTTVRADYRSRWMQPLLAKATGLLAQLKERLEKEYPSQK